MKRCTRHGRFTFSGVVVHQLLDALPHGEEGHGLAQADLLLPDYLPYKPTPARLAAS